MKSERVVPPLPLTAPLAPPISPGSLLATRTPYVLFASSPTNSRSNKNGQPRACAPCVSGDFYNRAAFKILHALTTLYGPRFRRSRTNCVPSRLFPIRFLVFDGSGTGLRVFVQFVEHERARVTFFERRWSEAREGGVLFLYTRKTVVGTRWDNETFGMYNFSKQ